MAKAEKMDALKVAMNDIGVTGMTVTRVSGCGVQKGQTAYYRGAKVDIQLLPKVKAEIVVSSIPVQTVVDAARSVLYTGHMGDGKIFIYNVENVVRISTGEQGPEALSYED
ncbi:P-II family nitrogen regulator [Catenibacterium mitsuokai]|nr:P-II family nitrogen regulator [Catenibacterium mitsuokai]